MSTTELKKPKISAAAQQELDKAEAQFQKHDEEVKSLTLDRMNELSKREDVEPQTKIAQVDLDKMKDIYLKPKRSISGADKFNEKFRAEYNFQKEYVHFTAENKETIGDDIEAWTKPFAGVPAEEWVFPANKPVWGPRYLAEQLKKCSYHRLTSDQRPITAEGGMTYYGSIVVDKIVQRLDAHPVSSRKSIFMGSAVGF